jgi:hypothetical protein
MMVRLMVRMLLARQVMMDDGTGPVVKKSLPTGGKSAANVK